jgi:hypothetical protein
MSEIINNTPVKLIGAVDTPMLRIASSNANNEVVVANFCGLVARVIAELLITK